VPPLPVGKEGNSAGKIVFVCSYVLGPYLHSSIGAADVDLAEAYAAAGHEVLILYPLGDYTETQAVKTWIVTFDEYKKIGLVPLPTTNVRYDAPWHRYISHEVYEWLKGLQEEIDVVFFHGFRGHAYYSVIAKHGGLAFRNTHLVVRVQVPTFLTYYGSFEYPDVDDLEMDYMERMSVKYADVVIGGSQFIFDWMTSEGWHIPATSYIANDLVNVGPPVTSVAPVLDPRPKFKITEIVFFGRMEMRKGLELFFNAIDVLSKSRKFPSIKITFVGKTVKIPSKGSRMEYQVSTRQIKDDREQRAWPYTFTVQDALSRVESIEYLTGMGRLAVIASIADSAPITVRECLDKGISFVASDIPGIRDLIHPDDRPAVLFKPMASALAAVLMAACTDGTVVARPAVPKEVVFKAWMGWMQTLIPDEATRMRHHEAMAEAYDVLLPPAPEADIEFTLCVLHRDRSPFLRQSVEDLKAQPSPVGFEVIIIDEGSVEAEAIDLIAHLRQDLPSRRWSVLQADVPYHSRTTSSSSSSSSSSSGPRRSHEMCAEAAKGDWVLVMRAEQHLKPNALYTWHRVATHAGPGKGHPSTIYTCPHDFAAHVSIDSTADERDAAPERWLPLGPALSAGLFRNVFGEHHMFVRRESLRALVSSTANDTGELGWDPWRFFAEASLKGIPLEIVPDPLYWRRSHMGVERTDVLNPSLRSARLLSVAKAYVDAVGPAMRNMILYSQALKFTWHDHAWGSHKVGEYRLRDDYR